MTYKLSPSSMNLIEDCPRCFWLQVVKKISRPSGAFPSLPSGIDKMLKEHFDRFMDNDDLPPELKKHKVDVEHAEWLFNRAIKIIKGEMPECGDKYQYCKWREI